MKEAIGIGDTVELAKEDGCKKLGVNSYDTKFEILQMPTKKTFGLFGGSPAKVRVYVEDGPAETAEGYLQNVLTCMGVGNVHVDIQKNENGALLNLTGDDIGFVIGHRGETLDALQYLTGLVANHAGHEYYRIALDIGNYREKRRQTLESLGKKMAEKSLRLGRNVSLEPMNPYERRIIHTSVQTVEGAKSWSEGEDLERHVVIGPVAGERNPRRGGKYNNRYHRQPPYNQKKTYGGKADKLPLPAEKNSASSQPQQNDEKPKSEGEGPLYGRVDIKK